MWRVLITALWLQETQAQGYTSEIRSPEFDFTLSFLPADGKLAGEIEILDQNIVRISQNSESDMEQLGEGVNTVLEATVQDLNSTITLEIVGVNTAIEAAREQLAGLEAALGRESDPCGVYLDCESCTEDVDCVWCSTSRQCLQGSSNGPYGFLCPDYDYRVCALVGCSRVLDCVGCVATVGCGWCPDRQQCMTGGVAESGECEPSLWLAGPRALCPVSTTIGRPEAVQAANPPISPNYINSDDISALVARITNLEEQLESLRAVQSRLGDDLNRVVALEVSVEGVNSRVLYLGDVVEGTGNTNESRDLDEARESGREALGRLSTAQNVTDSMTDRARAEDRALQPLASNTNTAARLIRENYATILDLMRANEARLRREVEERNSRAAGNATDDTSAVPADQTSSTSP